MTKSCQTGEKTFKCTNCQRRFTYKNYLTKHNKTCKGSSNKARSSFESDNDPLFAEGQSEENKSLIRKIRALSEEEFEDIMGRYSTLIKDLIKSNYDKWSSNSSNEY